MAASCIVSLFAEYKAKLSSINFDFLFESSHSAGSLDLMVQIEADFISVGDHHSSVYFYLEGIQLKPQSCRGLRVLSTNELTITAQVQRPEVEIVTMPYKVALQSTLVRQVQSAQNQCFCQNCGHKLLEDHCSFSRVLPLPSENWSEYADFWFCHNHGNESGKVPNALRPKIKDCLVGESYILLQLLNMKLGSSTVSKNGCVQCWRCRYQIGEMFQLKKIFSANSTVDNEVVKLFNHSVFFKDSLPDEEEKIHKSPWRRTEDFLYRFLLEQSRLYTSFRFLVQSVSETGKTVECLLWMLDTELSLYKAVSCLRRREVRVHPDRVAKVMYLCSAMGKGKSIGAETIENIMSLWKKDDTVHCCHISHTIFLQMVATLVHNTKCLPKSQRYLEGFHVGFLRHAQEDG